MISIFFRASEDETIMKMNIIIFFPVESWNEYRKPVIVFHLNQFRLDGLRKFEWAMG